MNKGITRTLLTLELTLTLTLELKLELKLELVLVLELELELELELKRWVLPFLPQIHRFSQIFFSLLIWFME